MAEIDFKPEVPSKTEIDFTPEVPATPAAPAAAEPPGFFARQTRPGGFFSPEVLATAQGGLIGAGLGSAGGPIGTFLGGLVGAGGGAMLGRGYEMGLFGTEGKNPLSEIGEASQRGMIGQATGEVLGKAIPAVTRGIAKHLPGSQAARVELGIDSLRSSINALLPKTASSEVRAAAMKHADANVPMRPVYEMLQDIIGAAKAKGAVQDTHLISAADGLAKKINLSGNRLTLAEVQGELSDIGRLTNNLRSQGQDVNPEFSRIFGAIATQLEKLPDGKLLRESANLYRKEQAVAEILEEVQKVVLQKRGSGTTDINANRFVKALERKKFITDSFEPGELSEVMTIAKELIELPAIPAGRGGSVGAGRVLGPPTAALGIESMFGLPRGIISGPLATMSGGAEMLRWLLPSERGRAVLKKVLQSGPMTQEKIAILTATARGISGENIPPLGGANQ